MSVRAAQLNHCKLFQTSPVYLGMFNRDGNTAAANIWIMLSLSLGHNCPISCFFFFSRYQISLIPDIPKSATKCLGAKRMHALSSVERSV